MSAAERAARWPSVARAHRTSGGDWIWRPTRLAIYARDGHACARCGATEDLSLDHIDDDAGDEPANLVTACGTCNSSRGKLPIDVFDPAYAERARELAAVPIDRALGRALCDERWPGFRARHVERSARRRAKGGAS
jgi:5-methylcytosine-specific restriction endonuclease McrA